MKRMTTTIPSWFPILGLASGLALAVASWLIWVYAPIELTMGLTQKIFYTHMPLAWWALFSFFVVFVSSIAYLRTKRLVFDHLAGAAAEIGVLFTTLALATGMLWGKAAWGVYWTWDPRLTTTLIMWFIYAAYLLVRGMDFSRPRRAMISAVIGIVAFIDVPLVFLSARLWRSIHPAVLASEGGGLTPEMQTTLVVSLLAWCPMWAFLLLARRWQLATADHLDSTLMHRED